jgi:D-glycero-D-manno-heptose 1,7-bisphosphate phosphatase
MGIAPLRRAVFFDRDGVLNEAVVHGGVPHPPASLEELHIVDGAAESVDGVREAGFLAIAVTNQPDVARGKAERGAVEALNNAVASRTHLDGIYACMHDDADACDCRKPKPGLLQRASREHGIDLRRSFLVGDRAKDVACGRAAGCTTIFIDRGYEETPAETGADVTVATLREAVREILSREKAVR